MSMDANATRMSEPTKLGARIARDVVEDVLLELRSLRGRVDRRGIVQSLEEALEALQAVESGRAEDQAQLDRLAGAREKCRTASDFIEGSDDSEASQRMVRRLRGAARSLDEAREAGLDQLVFRQGTAAPSELRGRAKEGLPKAEHFKVSAGLPHLFALERDVLRARVDTSVPSQFRFEDAARDAAEAEAMDEPAEVSRELSPEDAERPAFAADEPASTVDPVKRLVLLADQSATPSDLDEHMAFGLMGERAHIGRMVKCCFEEISATANLRRLDDTERFNWQWMKRTEARMTAGVDALMALGQPFFLASGRGAKSEGFDVLEAALDYGRDAFTADPGRAFARTFVLGCVAGEDTVRAAILALKQSPRYTHRAQTHALAMAPNPAIDEALVRLSNDEDRDLVVVALDALYGRGVADFAVLLPLTEHPDHDVKARAVRAMGVATQGSAAIEWLTEFIARETEDDLVVGGLEALSLLGAKAGLEHARDRLVDEVKAPGSLRTDVRIRMMQLLGVAGEREDWEILRANYGGEPGEALAMGFHGHPELIEALLEPLIEKVPRVMPGRQGLQEAAVALVRISGAPLYANPERPDRYEPTTEGMVWRAYFAEHRKRFEPGVRYRFGVPWSPLAPVDELAAEDVPVGTRRLAALELGMLLRERPVMLHDFAARQAEVLASQRASVTAELHGKGRRWRVGGWPDGDDSEA
ncbi:MAG: hypothetical protein EXR75_06430 [Myxococcales bacterium]|nr:hypothetical protein [Myxococcales bacterium]